MKENEKKNNRKKAIDGVEGHIKTNQCAAT